MIYWLLGITLLLLTVLEGLFFISLVRKNNISKYLGLSKNNRLPIVIFGLTTGIFFLILFLFIKKLSEPQPLTTLPVQMRQHVVLPEGFTELGHMSFTSQDSYYYLYTGWDTSQDALVADTLIIKNSICTKACTIAIYDTAKAYALDQERLLITSDTTMENWNKNNYIYVANHFLGYLPYIQYAPFTYYPYKDSYYKQLQSE